jgi:uncharacterized membrane protein YbhN (UPF0104 family)
MSIKRLLMNVVLVAALCLAAYLLYVTFERYTFDQVLQSVESIPLWRLAAAFGFVVASYFSLTLFDVLALRYIGKPLAYRKAAIASFVGLSIGHNLGVAALSSGAVRYRYYSRWGLNAEDVAKVILFCGTTVCLGLLTLAGLALLVNPADAANLLGLDGTALLLIGILCLGCTLAYLIAAAFVRGELKIWRWHFAMPPLRIAIGQVVVGTVNFVFVAACLHQVMAAFAPVSYVKAATAFVLANAAVVVTHVPGGLGVLEATVMHILPQAGSIGALVAFRVLYFFVPLAFGLPLLAISEMVFRARPQHSKQRRDAGPEQPGLKPQMP